MTGGCQCRSVCYRVAARSPVVYACHCRECQKQSASAFGLSLPVARSDFQVNGALSSWERATDLGSRTHCFFCPACGSRVYHASDRSPDRVTVKAGSLDDTSGLHPVAHIWVSRKQPWVIIPDAVPTHPTQPDDLTAWRSALTGTDQ